jgi:catechol 2,3-dioxygenase-like lactoylglutathione lyase family enzyme
METIFQHIALQYKNKKQADIFFKKILGLTLIKNFNVSKKLAKQIFNKSEEVEVFVYGNNGIHFEVFITKQKQLHVFNHVCIKIDDKKEFFNKCNEYKLKPYYVEKEDKKILFLRDYSNNLYEIK